jgi:hypothetical protein
MTHDLTLALCAHIVREVEFGPTSTETEENEWNAKLIQAKARLILQRFTCAQTAYTEPQVPHMWAQNDNDRHEITVCEKPYSSAQKAQG